MNLTVSATVKLPFDTTSADFARLAGAVDDVVRASQFIALNEDLLGQRSDGLVRLRSNDKREWQFLWRTRGVTSDESHAVLLKSQYGSDFEHVLLALGTSLTWVNVIVGVAANWAVLVTSIAGSLQGRRIRRSAKKAPALQPSIDEVDYTRAKTEALLARARLDNARATDLERSTAQAWQKSTDEVREEEQIRRSVRDREDAASTLNFAEIESDVERALLEAGAVILNGRLLGEGPAVRNIASAVKTLATYDPMITVSDMAVPLEDQ